MSNAETLLVGGRVTIGVTRIGDTVRRPMFGDRTLQHALLLHLEKVEFPATPRYLGIDDLGREILSYLPGEVPVDLGYVNDRQVSAAAILLRRFHDATSDFPPVQECGAQVICHNDWGPPNAVFQKGLPFGMIDFDTIAPGLRLWDLGYSAWTWLDIGNDDYAANEQVRRISLFVNAYGSELCSVSQIIACMVARQIALATSAKGAGNSETASWANSCADWTAIKLGVEIVNKLGI